MYKFLAPLVLSAYHGGETAVDGNLVPEALAAVDRRLGALMERLPEGSERPRLGSLQQRYMSNREHCIAADAAISSVTRADGWNHFQADRRPGRIGDNEVVYSVNIGDVPEELRESCRGMVRRACVMNTETRDTYLQIDWSSPLPSIWACTDGGADTWQHRLKMFYAYDIRGCEKYDPPHRAVRVRDRAINKSDGAWIKSEFGVIFSYVRGPWASEANFTLIGGGARELFKNFDENYPLFKLFIYERICRARNRGALPVGFGNPEHQKFIWEDIQNDKVITGLSSDYSANRWKSWSDRFLWYYADGSFDVLLLVALHILMTRGCIKNIEQDFPQLVGINKWMELMGGVQEIDAPVEIDIKDLKSASKQLESKRFKGSGTLLVCAESLCNLTTRKLGYATCHVPLPLENKMMNDLTQSGTQTGCFDWHVAQACGDAYEVIREVLGVCENWEILRELKVLMPEEVLSPTCLKEDVMVCKYAFELAKNAAIGELRTQSFYMERPPYAFFVRGHRWLNSEK